MAVKLLIVDDSTFFRKQIKDLLHGDDRIEIIAEATNGRQAVELAIKFAPDVITMDYEMPILNGISAIKEIMEAKPTAILMFSSMTTQGARVTFDALDAGAIDFLPKNYQDFNEVNQQKRILADKIIAVARTRRMALIKENAARLIANTRAKQAQSTDLKKETGPLRISNTTVSPADFRAQNQTRGSKIAGLRLVAIGTSTGGPVALQTVLKALPANFPLPIVLVQHMPGSFTGAFAERLNSVCNITIQEAADGMVMKPGHAYLAPGGMQLIFDMAQSNKLHVVESDPRLNYKPSVDVTFGSAAKVFGANVLSIVLTGMGADGKEGAKLLKSKGSTVWAQDEESSVIYGMPQAIVNAGLASQVLPLTSIASMIMAAIT